MRSMQRENGGSQRRKALDSARMPGIITPCMYRLITIIALVVTLLSGCSLGGLFQDAILSIKGKFPTKAIVLQTSAGEIKITAEIADSAKERMQGYMKRKRIDADSGMLFVFEKEVRQRFWMKDTKLSLDLVFFNKDKRVADIIENMEPCAIPVCSLYTSVVPAIYGLEVPAGFVKEKKIKIGDLLVY